MLGRVGARRRLPPSTQAFASTCPWSIGATPESTAATAVLAIPRLRHPDGTPGDKARAEGQHTPSVSDRGLLDALWPRISVGSVLLRRVPWFVDGVGAEKGPGDQGPRNAILNWVEPPRPLSERW